MSAIPKYSYCAECNCGFELEILNLKPCCCGKVRAKYGSDGETAYIYAENPEKAYFVGIRCCRKRILFQILDKDSEMKQKILDEAESRGEKRDLRIMIKYLESTGRKDFKKDLAHCAKYIPFCRPENLNSDELTSAVRETEEWKQFDRHKRKFEDIHDCEDWKSWKKGNEADDQKKWNSLLDKEGYAVGTVKSIMECKWHEKWEYRAFLQ